MWTIANIENNVCLTKSKALKLGANETYAAIMDYYEDHVWSSDDEMLNCLFDSSGKSSPTYYLRFIEDHMEHMDYVNQILPQLLELKVKGDITFGSLEGDNNGCFWGYRFDGKGGMKHLTGSVSFKESD